jgi:hypothetical protein
MPFPVRATSTEYSILSNSYSYGGTGGNNRIAKTMDQVVRVDGLVKSRHTGGNRCPVFGKTLKSLDSGFHRNDDSWAFSTFYEAVRVRVMANREGKYLTSLWETLHLSGRLV